MAAWCLGASPVKLLQARSEGSCTYLDTELGITILHGAELLERRKRRRKKKRSLLEVQAKGFVHLLHWGVCKYNPEVTAAKAQCNYEALMSIWDRWSLSLLRWLELV